MSHSPPGGALLPNDRTARQSGVRLKRNLPAAKPSNSADLGDHWLESDFLQRRVCNLLVPDLSESPTTRHSAVGSACLAGSDQIANKSADRPKGETGTITGSAAARHSRPSDLARVETARAVADAPGL
jgi:hypothetical protein